MEIVGSLYSHEKISSKKEGAVVLGTKAHWMRFKANVYGAGNGEGRVDLFTFFTLYQGVRRRNSSQISRTYASVMFSS